MNPVTLVLIVHDHQPVGNFDHVFRQAHDDAYGPFLQLLEHHPELRLALVEHRLRAHPSALDGTESAEIGAAAVQGVDGLEAYFSRYLPQVVLACIVPPAVLAYAGSVDLVAALVMLLTLPLVPVFMWLIGRYTEERTKERWDALRLLSTHFLDVVRGLPTLRAFNRSRAQTASIATVSAAPRSAGRSSSKRIDPLHR